jgi:hypothetical protein
MSTTPEDAEEPPIKKSFRRFDREGQAARLAAYIRRARGEAVERKPTNEVFDPEKDDSSDGYRRII